MIYESRFTINFRDVDNHNKIKPSSIMQYMQETAALQLDKLKDGLNYTNITNAVWILIGWKMKIFNNDISWNEECFVKTWTRKFEKFYSYREYEFRNKNNNLIAIATSKWIYLDLQSNAFKTPSNELIKKYDSENKVVFEKEISKLKEPKVLEKKFNYIVQKRDIDTNNHMNNVMYLNIAENVLPENSNIKEIEILYKKECKLNEIINVFSYETGNNEVMVVIKNNDNTKTHTILKLKYNLY